MEDDVGIIRVPVGGLPQTFEEFLDHQHREEPFYFGLGFIKFRFTDMPLGWGAAMHFYDPELGATLPPEEVHSHRQNFSSEIIGGSLGNEVYQVTTRMFEMESEPEGLGVYETMCAPGKPDEDVLVHQVNEPLLLSSTRMTKGSTYWMNRDAFHRVLPGPEGCITALLKMGDKSAAKVVRDVKSPPYCPYSKVIPKDELLGRIERLYKELT